jgi:hypothetical protein
VRTRNEGGAPQLLVDSNNPGNNPGIHPQTRFRARRTERAAPLQSNMESQRRPQLQRRSSDDSSLASSLSRRSGQSAQSGISSAVASHSPVKVATRLRPLRSEERQAIFPDWSSVRPAVPDGSQVTEHPPHENEAESTGEPDAGVPAHQPRSPTEEDDDLLLLDELLSPASPPPPSTGIAPPSASKIPSLSKSRWMSHQQGSSIPTRLLVESSLLSPAPSHTQYARTFCYDAVLAPAMTQAQVYQATVGGAIRQNLLRGYNTTVCAYGQWGSGKTYTMYGPPSKTGDKEEETDFTSSQNSEDSDSIFGDHEAPEITEEDGVVPRAMKDVFDAIAEFSEKEVTLEMTCLEVYRDGLRDLLVDRSKLPLQLYDRHHEQGNVVVQGLQFIRVHSLLQAQRLVRVAQRRRTTAATLWNEASSRSHVICTLHVTIAPTVTKSPSSASAVRVTSASKSKSLPKLRAKLTLVDLAGSERMQHRPAGKSNREALDLFVLGKVVAALASTPVGHVPYRDSKLTRLLRDSLGGTSMYLRRACLEKVT